HARRPLQTEQIFSLRVQPFFEGLPTVALQIVLFGPRDEQSLEHQTRVVALDLFQPRLRRLQEKSEIERVLVEILSEIRLQRLDAPDGEVRAERDALLQNQTERVDEQKRNVLALVVGQKDDFAEIFEGGGMLGQPQ